MITINGGGSIISDSAQATRGREGERERERERERETNRQTDRQKKRDRDMHKNKSDRKNCNRIEVSKCYQNSTDFKKWCPHQQI